MKKQRGFTLLEVMIALAILAMGLTWILRSTVTTVRNATDSRFYDAVTSLARSKMLDVEEQLMKDGFQETEQSSKGDFDEEGWGSITWEATVEKAKLPSLERLQQMQQAGEETAGSGTGTGTGTGSESDMAALNDAASGGGLMGMLSMMGGGDFSAEGAAGGSFIAMQYQLIEQVFEAAIRKVTLMVKWEVSGAPRELKVIAYFTDPAAMNRVIGGAGAAGAGDYGTDGEEPTSSGSGSGTGTGSGTSRGSTSTGGTRGGGSR